MLNIYIARHGQDEDNFKGILNGRRDKPLTKDGIKQANSVARKILKSNIKFWKIYSSPLKRAFKTAQIISEKINGPTPIILEDLIEREFGIMTGKHHSEIVNMCSPNILRSNDINYFLKPKGAETFPDLFKRGTNILKNIQNKHRSGNVLLTTHGDIGKMIYAAFYKLKWEETLKNFYFGNADLLLLSNNSPAENTHVFKISDNQTKEQMKKL